jgi:DNA end-binding protein Ku
VNGARANAVTLSFAINRARLGVAIPIAGRRGRRNRGELAAMPVGEAKRAGESECVPAADWAPARPGTTDPMPRSIWNGTVTFGLASVPIKLYSATESKSISFHEVHLRDGARIEHHRICPKHEREVPSEEVVKGYEIAEDKYVVLEADEIKAAAGDRGKVIHLEEFVDAAEIDPVFYEKTYFAGPRDDTAAYRVLHAALRRSGRAGIGRFSFHDREYLVAARALDDVIGLHTLRFHDEIVGGGDLGLSSAGRKPKRREVQMADKLVSMLEQDFDPREHEDTHRKSILELIKRKAAGKDIDLLANEEPEQGDDLTAALEASLGAGKG